MVVTVQATIVSDEPPQAGAEAPGVSRDGLPWRVRAGFLSRLRVFYRACGSKGDVCGVPGSGQPAELGGGEEPGRAACGLAGACQSFACVYRSALRAGPVTPPRLAVPVPPPSAPGRARVRGSWPLHLGCSAASRVTRSLLCVAVAGVVSRGHRRRAEAWARLFHRRFVFSRGRSDERCAGHRGSL